MESTTWYTKCLSRDTKELEERLASLLRQYEHVQDIIEKLQWEICKNSDEETL
jgi:hypothetical protein